MADVKHEDVLVAQGVQNEPSNSTHSHMGFSGQLGHGCMASVGLLYLPHDSHLKTWLHMLKAVSPKE